MKPSGRRAVRGGARLFFFLALASCASQVDFAKLISELESERAKSATLLRERDAARESARVRGEEISKERYRRRKAEEEASRLRGENEDRAERETIVLSCELAFAPGSHELTPAGAKALKELAQTIRSSGVRRVSIEGHTDSRPIMRSKERYASNMHLSVMRALEVCNHLVTGCGLPARLFSVTGFGSSRPASASDESKNRRVEIRLVR